MKIALLANTAWLDEELATLRQIAVGLLDEGCQIAQVLPRGQATDDILAIGRHLVWDETRRSSHNQRELRKQGPALEGFEAELIHALDGRLWRGAIDLGKSLDLPVVLSAGSAMDIEAAAGLASKIDLQRTTVVAGTAPLGAMIREVLPASAMVEVISPGVYPGSSKARPKGETLCAVVSGDGACDESVEVMLEGMHGALADQPEMQFFFDSQGKDPHRLWKAIKRMGLLPSSTLIPRRLGHREVLLRAGALLHPQALGRCRTLTLRAFAQALPVIAEQDPALDYLIHESTAMIIETPSPEDWRQAILWLARDRDGPGQLGQRAQRWVGEHRRASTQIDGLLHLYRSLTGTTLPFPG